MKIDMHCHLDLYEKPFEIANECKNKGVYVLSVTTTPKAWHGTKLVAENNPRIRTALGLHPQIAHQRAHEVDLFDSLLSEAIYVGEIGLDGGQHFKSHWEIQLKVFKHILRSVHKAGGRVMSLHSIKSADQVLKELSGIDGIPILHWFTGTQTELKKAIDIGCWFSVGPAMLSTKKGKTLVSKIPRNKILTETDGPFAKFNKEYLMPWDTVIAVEQLSNLWQTPQEIVEQQLKENFLELSRFSFGY